MRSKIKSMIMGAFMIALLLLLIALIVWRLRPVPFYAIVPLQADEVAFLEGTAVEFAPDDASAPLHTYQITAGSAADTNCENILSILEGTSFRPDMRNLLPHGVDVVGSGKNAIAYSVTLKFQCEQEDIHSFLVTFHGEKVVSLSTGNEDGFKVYHPSNRAAAKQLVEYIKKTGVEIA